MKKIADSPLNVCSSLTSTTLNIFSIRKKKLKNIVWRFLWKQFFEDHYEYLNWNTLQHKLLSRRAPPQMLARVPNTALFCTYSNKSVIPFDENKAGVRPIRQHWKLIIIGIFCTKCYGNKYWYLCHNLSWCYWKDLKFSWWC